MNLSLYIPGHSFLHKCPAWVKFGALVVFSLLFYSISSLSVIIIIFICAVALVFYIKIPNHRFRIMFLYPLLMVFAFSVFSTLMNDLHTGLLTFFRLSSLVIMAVCVTTTTRSEDFIKMIERVLLPLSVVFPFIRPKSISMTISLTLRFIPEIFILATDIREAQIARGLQSNPIALIVPLVVLTLKRADDISDAIDARTTD